MGGQRAPPASFRLTTEGRCTADASHWERAPPGVTQWTKQPEQRMECHGDIVVGILVLGVWYLTVKFTSQIHVG